MRAKYRLLSVLSLLLALALTSCSVTVGAPATPAATGTPSASTSSGKTHRVNLKVVKGPHGSVLALVPVYIDGHGPFVFALDTGSSRSVITTSLAKHFHLKMVGQTGQISGVASTTHANLVKVNQWRVGSITLDARTVTSLSFPSNNGGGSKLQGLLGSDVLSQFSRVTIEYNKGVLILSR